MIYGVVAFSSAHDAMTTQKLLKPLMPVIMLPTPRCITASCGISLRFALEDLSLLRQTLPPLTDYEVFRVGDEVCERIEL